MQNSRRCIKTVEKDSSKKVLWSNFDDVADVNDYGTVVVVDGSFSHIHQVVPTAQEWASLVLSGILSHIVEAAALLVIVSNLPIYCVDFKETS